MRGVWKGVDCVDSVVVGADDVVVVVKDGIVVDSKIIVIVTVVCGGVGIVDNAAVADVVAVVGVNGVGIFSVGSGFWFGMESVGSGGEEEAGSVRHVSEDEVVSVVLHLEAAVAAGLGVLGGGVIIVGSTGDGKGVCVVCISGKKAKAAHH